MSESAENLQVMNLAEKKLLSIVCENVVVVAEVGLCGLWWIRRGDLSLGGCSGVRASHLGGRGMAGFCCSL